MPPSLVPMTRKRSTNAPRVPSGFTLLELMIVIIIAGIMMAIALPKMAPVRVPPPPNPDVRSPPQLPPHASPCLRPHWFRDRPLPLLQVPKELRVGTDDQC